MTTRILAIQGTAVREAAGELAQASDEQRRGVLSDVANLLDEQLEDLLRCNALEVALYEGVDAGRDRLSLTRERVQGMAHALRDIASAPDPLDEVLDQGVRPNGLRVERVRVPLGVVGVVYENRPNVTSDVAGLCVRSGNAAFLRGSGSAMRTNAYVVDLFQRALTARGLPRAAVSLVEDPSHEAAVAFMQLTDVIDCLIPRGGAQLVAALREHARVPYVLDGEGNCHIFVDESANLEQSLAIVRNAKTSRPGVCNAVETVLVHEAIASAFLPALALVLSDVELRVDEVALEYVPGATRATDDDFAREFLDLVLAIKVVGSLEDALAHVALYGTGHSEAILTENLEHAETWIRRVDAAAVLVNASTRFVDGGELGLGAEVGISTQKLHARGPMGLRDLTCLKWVVRGKGQLR